MAAASEPPPRTLEQIQFLPVESLTTAEQRLRFGKFRSGTYEPFPASGVSDLQLLPYLDHENSPKQCKCGNIPSHDHRRGFNNFSRGKMNGAHPPTGPRIEANSIPPASPATASPTTGNQPKRIGRLPDYVQVAKSYVFEQQIQKALKDNGVSQAREDTIRLAGVQWIDNVRRALKLPVKTFNTAVVYFHKFRLQHSDGEYSFVDASAAALFTACKIEDTLKKSKDILCAAHNLKAPRNEQVAPDDPMFEHHSRTIIGLERLMLEASGFDFRNRHPQDFLIKLLKSYSYERSSPVVGLAYTISLDLYRTWAPVKQSTATMAFACLELAERLLANSNNDPRDEKKDMETMIAAAERDYDSYRIDRGMVMETLLDLLELYTHHRAQTMVGPDFPVDRFLEVRIPLNLESEERGIPRYTAWVEGGDRMYDADSGGANAVPTVNGTPAAHAGGGMNGSGPGSKGRGINSVSPRDGAAPGQTSPIRRGNAAASAVVGVRQRVGERGREGTVRFILNPDRARDEKSVVDLFRQD